MPRMPTLAGTMLARAAGTATMAADQGRTAGPPIGGAHKGVIAGRVTDTSGQPVPGVFVTLMQRSTSFGVPRLHPVSIRFGSTTNANGEYSLERLIRVSVGRQEWAVKALRLNGVDLGGNNIEFRAGHDISGLEVELGKPIVR